MDDPCNLQRFVDAQQHVFADVIAELGQGSKRGHWMWFIFPQLKGLGRTAQSNFFGISSVQEAAAYLQHPVLGPRLIECTQLVNAIEGRSAEDIFGEIDAMKFRSSMTLFAYATPENQIFTDALGKYYAGEFDPLTIAYLRKQASKLKAGIGCVVLRRLN
ncbi:MAG: DUF1810 domain-containing protein [Acidobacteria bacterium]|nr:MAG: DUF1810 domain-containing protein [Acidobacteriota bacterium]